jgi:hypothetical protein
MGVHNDKWSISKIGGIALSCVGMGVWQGMKNPTIGAPCLVAGMAITMVGGPVELYQNVETVVAEEKKWEGERATFHPAATPEAK